MSSSTIKDKAKGKRQKAKISKKKQETGSEAFLPIVILIF